MDLLLRYIPWQIQVLILIVCISTILPYIPKISKKGPKIITIAVVTLILVGINLIFILIGENMGDIIGITHIHVDILHYSFAVLLVLSLILIFIGRYQQVKHDEKERKHVLKQIRGVIISAIIFIIAILFAILMRYLE